MKSKVFITSLLTVVICSFSFKANACGEIGGPVGEYLLYRVYDTSKPVYNRPVIEQLQESDDPEVMEYLRIARTCQAMREKMNSKWYYPSKNDPVVSALEEVLQKSLEYKGSKLKERYALQAARAMFTLGRFEQMCQWWSEIDSQIAPGAIREHIIGYVAGAKYRTGEVEVALDYYSAIGDVESIEYCLRYAGDFNGYSSIREYVREYPAVYKTLQDEITRIEVYADYYLENKPEVFYNYYMISMENAQESLDPAPWLYTAAFVKFMTGEYHVAKDLVTRAEKCCSSQFMSDSIRVLRILLDAKISAYDSEYETKLLEDLEWLDMMICGNITDQVREKTADEGFYIDCNSSYYYWNDMMRKIVLGTVVPRMVEAGKTPQALLLANYADNRLLSLVDWVCDSYWESDGDEYKLVERNYTLSEYRRASGVFNEIDYSCDYFGMLNSNDTYIGSIIEYSSILRKPTGNLQAFLVERAYIDDDYLNDLIGTRYLRIAKYEKAYAYLSKVSKEYQTYLNTYEYMRRLPFHYNRKKASDELPDYKLDFARQMIECEKIMFSSTDPEKVGHARIKYGIGMRNSQDWCWILTDYKRSYRDYYGKENKLLVIGDRQIRSGLNQQTNSNHCDILADYY